MNKIKSFCKIAFLVVALSVVISSCKKSDSNEPTTDASVQLTLTDVAYGSDAAQKMDIYLPANRKNDSTNVLVLIHGGGWTAGDKTDFNTKIPALQANLYKCAVVNINYRLASVSGTNLWPTQINDVNAALDYITTKANYYHINAAKIAVLGASAGAHLALLKGYKYNSTTAVKCVIDYFGPTDMVDLYNFQTASVQPAFALFMGGTPTANPTAYASASPLNAVIATCPATMIFHGDADAVVPVTQSQRLRTALTTAGVTNFYYEYAGEPHGQFSTASQNDADTKAVGFINISLQQ